MTKPMGWIKILTDRQTDRVNSAVFFEYNKIAGEIKKHPDMGITRFLRKPGLCRYPGVFCVKKYLCYMFGVYGGITHEL